MDFGVKVLFEFFFLDMMWLVFMGGEMFNVVFYFFFFGNVNDDIKFIVNRILGKGG